jgi:hypothetical protein
MFRRVLAQGLLLAVVFLGGCDVLNAKIKKEQLATGTVWFKPKVAKGGIESWWYEFRTDQTQVLGCNKERVYTATSWTFNEDAQRVRVYFGSEWEEYTLTVIDDEAFDYGEFRYDSSVGVQMEGTWLRDGERYCTSRQ